MEPSFKSYVPGDEPALIGLWNRVYAQYGGFVTKTEERWRWSILQYGAVSAASIVIAILDGTVSAYGALASTGVVIEFAVDTNMAWRQRRKTCIALVEKLEDRARELKCDSLSFVTPASDSQIDSALRELGYTASGGDCLSLGVLNPVALISALLAHPKHQLPITWNRRILIHTPPGGYPIAMQSKILIDVVQGRASVIDATSLPTPAAENIDWHIKIDLAALTDVVFRLMSFRNAIHTNRIELDDRLDVADAETFFNALQIRAEWYTPISDTF